MTGSLAALMAALLVASAFPALAENMGDQPPGPPLASGNPDGTNVVHCKTLGGEGVVVIHPEGTLTGGGECVHGND